MPKVYNGKKFKADKSLYNTSKKIGRRQSLLPTDTLDEPEFRGFRKQPTVVLQRIDLTAYTDSALFKKIPVNSQPETDLVVIATKQCLLQKCCVKLENDDLEKLREQFLRPKPASPSSPDGDQPKTMQSPASGSLSCKVCDKVYSNEKKLHNHQENKHMIIYKPEEPKPLKRVSFSDKVIVHELKEYHKCRKCPKIFENYRMLKKHMKLQHKKRKCYICNYCSKKFIDRMFFKVHIKLHCDVCTLLLPNKKSFNAHRRNVCRVLKLFKCKECNDSFFSFMDLKDHSYSHTDVLLVCDVCKDQFQTKCALAHHLAFLHSKKRPKALYSIRNLGTERLYLCDFCDESSVEKDIIESHLQLLPDLTNRAMTGYKDYYFCDQCFKKFDTETEMLTHKWTHFLKLDESVQKPKGILLNSPKNTYSNGNKIKFRIDEELPNHFKPTIRLERINTDKYMSKEKEDVDIKSTLDLSSILANGEIKKAIVDPKSKKTLISKHQCQNCSKYFSSNYCLNRHIDTQHSDFENLQCKVCEEIFVWPSLLKSHKCIRLTRDEMPFDDARPEVHFDNLNEIHPQFDDIPIEDDYLNAVDFDIPTPIVELQESEQCMVMVNNNGNNFDVSKTMQLQNLGYRLVMQEVPIEF